MYDIMLTFSVALHEFFIICTACTMRIGIRSCDKRFFKKTFPFIFLLSLLKRDLQNKFVAIKSNLHIKFWLGQRSQYNNKMQSLAIKTREPHKIQIIFIINTTKQAVGTKNTTYDEDSLFAAKLFKICCKIFSLGIRNLRRYWRP